MSGLETGFGGNVVPIRPAGVEHPLVGRLIELSAQKREILSMPVGMPFYERYYGYEFSAIIEEQTLILTTIRKQSIPTEAYNSSADFDNKNPAKLEIDRRNGLPPIEEAGTAALGA